MKPLLIAMDDNYKRRMVESAHWLDRESPAEHYYSLLKGFIRTAENKRLLDVGCAQGEETDRFRRLGFAAEGIDLNDEFVSAARMRWPHCRFDTADAEQLPHESDAFDVVFCINTLFFTNMERSIPELLRVLKPSGHGVISYDIEIKDLERESIIHATTLQFLNHALEGNEVVHCEYKERIDASPFRHRHRYYEVIFQKQNRSM